MSVRNLRNIPKVSLTVKPDPNETLNRSLNHVNGTTNSNGNLYYGTTNYVKPSDSIYTNGQVPQHIQDQYAVVKKTGSKRDIRENHLERENSAIFKVSCGIFD